MACLRQREPRRKNALKRVRRVIDYDAVERGEPGLTHSFVASLATAMDCAGYITDPVDLMGASGFAFRIWIEQRLLPNAMNAFDWEAVLPAAVQRAGFSCEHIRRYEREADLEAPRRTQAHTAITRSIDRGAPAIVWDPSDPPMWGLITGYNDFTQIYDTSAFWGYSIPLAYDKLGRRDVDCLSVILLGEPRDLGEDLVLKQSLHAALLHAQGYEGRQFDRVRSGLAAYARWAELLQPGFLADHEFQFADYTAEMFYAFRCYARDFLKAKGQDSSLLHNASRAYADVADNLREVHEAFQAEKRPADLTLRRLRERILCARASEIDALNHIADFLGQPRIAT
ncbi:hypothetical protein KKG90_12945 [Candidatus Bipolaricaulota bacterium]|nr:hypothetical protein [Candidatus Bipolaricaulota bacterium]